MFPKTKKVKRVAAELIKNLSVESKDEEEKCNGKGTQDVWSVQLPLALIIAYVEHKPKSARLSISNMSKPNKIIGNMSYQLPSVHLPMLKLFTGTSPFTIASIREAAINVHWVSYVLIIHGFIFI
nr:hypothetical protein Iba_chr10dCG14660 [Ipomoea batatas]